MSDSEQDVTQFVVSASLSSCFSPIVPRVKSNKDSNHATVLCNNDFESNQSNLGSETDERPEFFEHCASEIDQITTIDKISQNIAKISSDAKDTDAYQEKSNSIKYPSTCCADQPDDVSDGLAFVDVHYKSLSNETSVKGICTDLVEKQNDLETQSRFSVECFDCKDEVTKEKLLKEDNFSGSTDGTLQNSENSSDNEGLVINSKQDLKRLIARNNNKMGNKQAQAPKVQSDDDTPDDGRTKCCQVPKRKIKEKRSQTNRASGNDDLNFDSNEVYPFEGRSTSEQDINEPVELEPFEIVETDDIKFVPGAGTSDVIKSVNEPRFTTIAEESAVSEETQDSVLSPSPKLPLYIDKGNRLVEPGTATAHSTFEFKQVKPKIKYGEVKSDHTRHNYENIGRLEEMNEPNVVERKVSSSSSSKSSSSFSSKDGSRKNSKDAIQKPSRKGKSKDSVDILDNSSVGQDDKRKKTKKENENVKKQQSVRDSEIDRKIDSVLMLTQTMFSQTKVPEVQDKNKDQSQPVALNQYENVGVCAKLEPSGIVITHKNVNNSNKQVQETTQDIKSGATCSGNNCGEPKEKNKLSMRQHYSKLSKDIVEISESGTLIIKSLADLPSDGFAEEVEDQQKDGCSPSISLSSEDIRDETDRKIPYETIERPYAEINKDKIDLERNNEKDTINVTENTENVPPPSPLAMEVLEEEEEEDSFEENENEINNWEDDRRKSEIFEFTESVCKRLSHLLEVMSDQDNDEEDDTLPRSPERERATYEDHIYETIDGFSKFEATGDHSGNNKIRAENWNEQENHVSRSTCETIKYPLVSDESFDAHKYTSGESETNSKPTNSDDDLPDYFDPRQDNQPETLDDFESYENKGNDCLFSEEVSNAVHANKESLKGLQYDNIVLESKDKNFSLPVQSFENGLINDAPPSISTEDILDITPTSEAQPKHTALPELAQVNEETPVQFDTSGRQSATCTESDIDVSEHRDDLSTDSMLADDEAEETMEILFTKTYTEPVEGAEVFLSCTVVNSAYKDEPKRSETWLSDEALEYFEANASEVMSTAFLKAKKEMKDIQVCLQSLRQQMEHFHSDCDDISLPEIPVDSLSPDYFGIPIRKAVTD